MPSWGGIAFQRGKSRFWSIFPIFYMATVRHHRNICIGSLNTTNQRRSSNKRGQVCGLQRTRLKLLFHETIAPVFLGGIIPSVAYPMGSGESKLTFRKSIVELASSIHPIDDNAFWLQFLDLPATVDDIFSLVPSADARLLRRYNAANIATFLIFIINHLDEASKKDVLALNDIKRVENALAFLQRLLPFVFESVQEGERDQDIGNRVFWGTGDVVFTVSIPVNQPELAENGEEAAEIAAASGGVSSTENAAPVRQDVDVRVPLQAEVTYGKLLIQSMGRLLFKVKYTVYPSTLQNVQFPHQNLLWEGGLLGTVRTASDSTVLLHRLSVLKTLCLVLSADIYKTQEELEHSRNRLLVELCVDDFEYRDVLFYSLINSVLAYDPVGWGIPYGSMISSNVDMGVASFAASLLILLLQDRKPEEYTDASKVMTVSGPETAPTNANPSLIARNFYRVTMMSLHEEKDLNLMMKSFVRMMKGPLNAASTYLPQSVTIPTLFREVLIIMWHVTCENTAFRTFLIKSPYLNSLVVPILFLIHEHRKDVTNVGLLHACVFFILLLSGERYFCVALNQPLKRRLPLDVTITGNVSDFLIFVLHRCLLHSLDKFGSLYDCIMTILANVSPYVRSISPIASKKLVHLFDMFSSANFLLSGPENKKYLFYTLEIMNNLVQYQFRSAIHVVYELLSRAAAVDTLLKLDSLVPDHAAILEAKAKEAGKEEFFLPTVDWVMSWRADMKIDTLQALISNLGTQVHEYCETAGVNDELQVTAFIENTTLVGLLPVPHPILIRRYHENTATHIWFRVYAWGLIFLRYTQPPALLGTAVKLFVVQHQAEGESDPPKPLPQDSEAAAAKPIQA